MSSVFVKLSIYSLISLLLTAILIGIPYLINFNLKRRVNHEIGIYECGFQSFGGSRSIAGIQYYLFLPLFLIFAAEVAFLVPWVCSWHFLSNFGYQSGLFFLYVLFVGLLFEIFSAKYF